MKRIYFITLYYILAGLLTAPCALFASRCCRMFVWRSLLCLPENHAAYSSLTDKGLHSAFLTLHEKYPIKSQKLQRALQRFIFFSFIVFRILLCEVHGITECFSSCEVLLFLFVPLQSFVCISSLGCHFWRGGISPSGGLPVCEALPEQRHALF